MKRLLMLAVACLVGAAGCSDDDPAPPPPASQGRHGVNFWVSVSGGAGGTVSSADQAIDCGSTCGAFFAWSSPVTLTATPDDTHVFRGWAGACSGAAVDGAVCTLPSGAQLNSAADRAVVAIFDPLPPPPAGTAPKVAVATAGTVTDAPVAITLAAIDPDEGDAISCAFELRQQPRFSAVALGGALSGDCRDAELTATFTPAFDGVYVVRATVTDGVVQAPITRDVTITVASRYGGGVVSGTSATPTAATTQLAADLATIPVNGGAVTAQNVFRAFANIPTTGTPPVQGPALSWAQRPYDVIDVRDPADFAAGHIPGAINVPLDRLPGVLLASPYFPDPSDRRRVLVAGYSQGDSSLGAILVTAGRFGEGAIPAAAPNDHRVFFLAQGMAAWTFDKAAAPLRWGDDLGTRRFQWTLADTTYLEASGAAFTLTEKPTYPYPAIGAFNAATLTPMKRVLVRAREWTAWALADADARSLPRSEAFVTHWGRYKEARDAGQTPQVVSTQSDAQWQAAHVVGAYRGITPTNVEHIKYLDPARPVLVHCFTNTGAVSPCFQLSVMGYPSRTVLYGITGAIAPALTAAGYNTGFVAGVEDKGSGGNDFPVASQARPAPGDSLAWARPSAAGCRACHADYAAHYAEVTLRPFTAPVPEVASEGEG